MITTPRIEPRFNNAGSVLVERTFTYDPDYTVPPTESGWRATILPISLIAMGPDGQPDSWVAQAVEDLGHPDGALEWADDEQDRYAYLVADLSGQAVNLDGGVPRIEWVEHSDAGDYGVLQVTDIVLRLRLAHIKWDPVALIYTSEVLHSGSVTWALGGRTFFPPWWPMVTTETEGEGELVSRTAKIRITPGAINNGVPLIAGEEISLPDAYFVKSLDTDESGVIYALVGYNTPELLMSTTIPADDPGNGLWYIATHTYYIFEGHIFIRPLFFNSFSYTQCATEIFY